MSRRLRSKNRHRDANVPSLADELDADLTPSRPVSPSPINTRFEDRRRWVPGVTAPREALGRPARVVYQASRRGALTHKKASGKSAFGAARKTEKAYRLFRSVAERPQFADARSVIICIKRKTRREVLFAKKRTGRGARSKKHYSPWSTIRC